MLVYPSLRKVALIATSVAVCSILTVLILRISYERNQNKSHFFRRFSPQRSDFKVMNLNDSSYYIAGITREYIYLGSEKTPDLIVAVNHMLSDSLHLKLNIHDSIKQSGTLRMTIDSPNYYLVDKKTPFIYGGKLSDLSSRTLVSRKKYYKDFVPLSQQSFIFSTYNSNLSEQILSKYHVNSPTIKTSQNLLTIQSDCLICSDGMLLYDRSLAYLVYVYHYNNQFLVYDTALNLKYKYRTIDRTSYAKSKGIAIAGADRFSQTSRVVIPPKVNKLSCVSGDLILINSGIKSDNESRIKFDAFSVIDIYSVRNGNYIFSFRIPTVESIKMRDFKVLGKTLIALNGQYIQVYSLNFLKSDVLE